MRKLFFVITFFVSLINFASAQCVPNLGVEMAACANGGGVIGMAQCLSSHGHVMVWACLNQDVIGLPTREHDAVCGSGEELEYYQACRTGEFPKPENGKYSDDQCGVKGSIIYPESLTYTESIPLVGVPHKLVYSSFKVKGRKIS